MSGTDDMNVSIFYNGLIMRNKTYLLRTVLVITSLIITVSSCKKDDYRPVYDYFVSEELAVTYSTTSINNMLDAGVQLYPGLTDIKEFVGSDVNVHKMVYNTTVDGESIEASGLVCVPVTPGAYPVLSFQNGTNTVNEYAPSEYVINPTIQLVEYIASMGFIVMIPDYPGFGESAHIPHPYLVAEPTVTSVVDMLYAFKESCEYEFTGIDLIDEYYLLGYSQGGWATLNLHKALELDYSGDFDLAGSVCGAGPYNMLDLFNEMTDSVEYQIPAYLGYIVNAYSYYNQFTNSVCDIFQSPYCENLSSLYNGTLSISEINDQLTTVISDLFNNDFLTGFESSSSYASVREALTNNSVSAWITGKPVLFIHGSGDTHVSVTATEKMYDAMITAGTSQDICTKVLIPDLDHTDAALPSMIEGLMFILELKDNRQ